ncbi:hypothetical protein CRUP_030245 [Coryphaenoides rupestris]|nr:hypothetical protein CRUP_030245 [Coryphaenoides rupestris]
MFTAVFKRRRTTLLLLHVGSWESLDDPTVCSISNPDFVIYSSVVSFYLPFIVTLLVYIRIYVFLRMRRKRIAFRQASGKVRPDISALSVGAEEPTGPPKSNLLSMCLRAQRPRQAPWTTPCCPVDTNNYCSISHASLWPHRDETWRQVEAGAEGGEVEVGGTTTTSEDVEVGGGVGAEERRGGRRGQGGEQAVPGGGNRPPRARLRPPRFRSMHARERKATQMLAIFLGGTLYGVFLICWLPFFITHILNTHCGTCYIPPTLYSAVTWLGYVNSALNPVIYTTFNVEFRRAFIKILSC